MKTNNQFLTAFEILDEMLSTSSANLVCTLNEFEHFVERSKFTCMEDALYRTYEAGLVDGCVA